MTVKFNPVDFSPSKYKPRRVRYSHKETNGTSIFDRIYSLFPQFRSLLSTVGDGATASLASHVMDVTTDVNQKIILLPIKNV